MVFSSPGVRQEWWKWRCVRELERAGAYSSVAARLLEVESVLLIKRGARNPAVRAELPVVAVGATCSPAAQVVLLREGVAPEVVSTVWKWPALLRWLWLRVCDRETAQLMMQSMVSSPHRWAFQRMPYPALALAWAQFLNDEEKKFVASYATREDLWVVRWLPGGLEAWMQNVMSGQEHLHLLTWALREAAVEKRLLRACSTLPGVPRALMSTTGGSAALMRWFGAGWREEIVTGVAKEFPGSLEELREVAARV
jgi:hypothetical protein